MTEEYRILSGYNEDVEYTFESMNLELEDEMTESDIHIIELFGKPYSIAMGKLNLSERDETLGYFICYLLYQDKVVRKLGIYEINVSANEMETIDHRTFDFQKEKLLLFDEYYEDVNKLRPYKYNKEEEVSKKTMIKLKQSDIEFEENKEKRGQFISELQTRIDKYKPEKTQDVIDQYYEYIKNVYNLLENRKIKSSILTKLKSPVHDYFKVTKQDGGGIFIDFEKSNLFDTMMNPNIKIGYFELVVLEVLANVKILLVEDGELKFELFEYKEKASFEKIDRFDLYSKFDPTDVIFIHKTMNQDNELEMNMLLYKDKLVNTFEDLDTKLGQLIIQKLNENGQEAQHPSRFINLKQMLKNKNVDNKEKEDAELAEELSNEIEELGDPDEVEEPQEPEEPEEPRSDDERTGPIKLTNQTQNKLRFN